MSTSTCLLPARVTFDFIRSRLYNIKVRLRFFNFVFSFVLAPHIPLPHVLYFLILRLSSHFVFPYRARLYSRFCISSSYPSFLSLLHVILKIWISYCYSIHNSYRLKYQFTIFRLVSLGNDFSFSLLFSIPSVIINQHDQSTYSNKLR